MTDNAVNKMGYLELPIKLGNMPTELSQPADETVWIRNIYDISETGEKENLNAIGIDISVFIASLEAAGVSVTAEAFPVEGEPGKFEIVFSASEG